MKCCYNMGWTISLSDRNSDADAVKYACSAGSTARPGDDYHIATNRVSGDEF